MGNNLFKETEKGCLTQTILVLFVPIRSDDAHVALCIARAFTQLQKVVERSLHKYLEAATGYVKLHPAFLQYFARLLYKTKTNFIFILDRNKLPQARKCQSTLPITSSLQNQLSSRNIFC